MKYFFVLLLTFASMLTQAQDDVIAKYKAMFTLNFIRYVGWPEQAKQGDFVIGVLRNAKITQQMQTQTAGKKFGYQNIVVKEFKNVDEVTDCQILYFSSTFNYNKHAAVINDKLGNKNSLIITEKEGAVNAGSMINFVVRDGKLKFELAGLNAQKFGLKFSGSLTSLSNAIVIN